jgi:hypothetical protein
MPQMTISSPQMHGMSHPPFLLYLADHCRMAGPDVLAQLVERKRSTYPKTYRKWHSSCDDRELYPHKGRMGGYRDIYMHLHGMADRLHIFPPARNEETLTRSSAMVSRYRQS